MLNYILVLAICFFTIFILIKIISFFEKKQDKNELINLWLELRKKELTKMGKLIFLFFILSSCSNPNDRYWVSPYSKNGIDIMIIFDKERNEFCVEESGKNFKYEDLGKQCNWGK